VIPEEGISRSSNCQLASDQMRTLRIAVLIAGILGISFSAMGQNLSVGIIGGGSLTDSFPLRTRPLGGGPLVGYSSDTSYSSSKDYIVGPAVEFWFLPHWSVEVDGMYRKLHYTTASMLINGSLAGVSPSPVITWEFPVLAKYHFELWKVKPLFELGPSFRTAGNLNGTGPSHVGFTSGIGIGMDVRNLKIEPVLRYTRWTADGVSVFQAKSKPDQLELLVGFSVAPESNLRPLGGRFSVGLLAGADLTDGTQAQTFSFGSVVETLHPNRALLVGPAVDLELFNHLSVEVDAIYHPLRSTI
jgi:hypothetical protein